jgi:tetratricopeptide (TPR) repeat protein
MRNVLTFMIFTGLLAPGALAQEEAPVEAEAPAAEVDPDTEARAAFLEGRTQYNLGNFQAALIRFKRAYELRPAPLLLFNLGQCYRHMRNHERAIFFFDGYLREDPTTSDRELVLGLIAEEKKLLAAQRAKVAEAKAAAAEAEREPALTTVETPVEPARTFESAPEPAPVTEADDAWVPWAIGGGAAVVVAAAGVTIAVLASAPQGRQGLAPPTFGELDLR